MSNRIKKFDELTKETKKAIKDAKAKLLDAIINDTDLSKVEKLRLISDNDLFKIDIYIRDPFVEHKNEYLEELGKKGITNPIIDNYISRRDYERRQIVDLADLVEWVNEDDEDIITVYLNRTSDDEFKLSRYEFIDTIYDWCVNNKTIGFKYDW